mmetsp:Transcript_16898/g.26861  ORF Transcript_16898/g.26861 Transcript_16898/m.26861 type:complete len:228 (+) Transcript_16898:910-1593(+)
MPWRSCGNNPGCVEAGACDGYCRPSFDERGLGLRSHLRVPIGSSSVILRIENEWGCVCIAHVTSICVQGGCGEGALMLAIVNFSCYHLCAWLRAHLLHRSQGIPLAPSSLTTTPPHRTSAELLRKCTLIIFRLNSTHSRSSSSTTTTTTTTDNSANKITTTTNSNRKSNIHNHNAGVAQYDFIHAMLPVFFVYPTSCCYRWNRGFKCMNAAAEQSLRHTQSTGKHSD